eukprot:m.74620 g.74620  ORF g.74620 m.74620 type:complete len:220 (-) comp7775_c0_seq2:1686-2345(-)
MAAKENPMCETFCGIPQAVLSLGPDTLMIGRCVPQRHHAFFNAEVGPTVRARNGVFVHLNDEAQAKILRYYDGSPLLVRLGQSCCDCDCKFACCVPSCKCCEGGDCAIETADSIAVDSIWFGRTSVEAMLPSVCACICRVWCGLCNAWVNEVSHTILIPPSWVTIADVTVASGPPAPTASYGSLSFGFPVTTEDNAPAAITVQPGAAANTPLLGGHSMY